MLRANHAAPSGVYNAFQENMSAKDAFDETQSVEAKSCTSDAIVIVERHPFLRHCLHRSVAGCWPGTTIAYASISELAKIDADISSNVIVLSIISLTAEEADAEFAQLVALDPSLRVIVLSETDDANEALAALEKGANGYIAMSAGFEIFIQAMRFVAAGGTYVPPQCLMAAKKAPTTTGEQASAGGISSRERAVIQAIRQGKPNKVIAYELNMCESTVKVHVRNIMKKLHAKNRTDVAIKGAEAAQASACKGDSGPLPALRLQTTQTGNFGKLRETGQRQSSFA
jgi:DNA-binding NarL/FixJ family response regulator